MKAMPTFSERIGAVPPRALQVDGLDGNSTVALTNLVETYCRSIEPAGVHSGDPWRRRGQIATALLSDHFHYRLGELPSSSGLKWTRLLEVMGSATWHDLLSSLEHLSSLLSKSESLVFRESINLRLERYNVGYRFMGDQLVPITSAVELDAVSGAIESAGRSARGVAIHLDAAVRLLRQPGADYRNSIKESISAVEGAVKHLTGQESATLGEGLKAIRHADAPLHRALSDGWNKLYGWTSNAEGIRHALMDEPNVGLEEALYMLVSCSAFVSYLLAPARAS